MLTHSGRPPHPRHSSSSAGTLPQASALPAIIPNRPTPAAPESADQTRTSSPHTHTPPPPRTPRPSYISRTGDSEAHPGLEPLGLPLRAARPQGRTAVVGEVLVPTLHLANHVQEGRPRPSRKAATTLLGVGPSGPATGAGPSLDPGAVSPAQPSQGRAPSGLARGAGAPAASLGLRCAGAQARGRPPARSSWSLVGPSASGPPRPQRRQRRGQTGEWRPPEARPLRGGPPARPWASAPWWRAARDRWEDRPAHRRGRGDVGGGEGASPPAEWDGAGAGGDFWRRVEVKATLLGIIIEMESLRCGWGRGPGLGQAAQVSEDSHDVASAFNAFKTRVSVVYTSLLVVLSPRAVFLA